MSFYFAPQPTLGLPCAAILAMGDTAPPFIAFHVPNTMDVSHDTYTPDVIDEVLDAMQAFGSSFTTTIGETFDAMVAFVKGERASNAPTNIQKEKVDNLTYSATDTIPTDDGDEVYNICEWIHAIARDEPQTISIHLNAQGAIESRHEIPRDASYMTPQHVGETNDIIAMLEEEVSDIDESDASTISADECPLAYVGPALSDDSSTVSSHLEEISLSDDDVAAECGKLATSRSLLRIAQDHLVTAMNMAIEVASTASRIAMMTTRACVAAADSIWSFVAASPFTPQLFSKAPNTTQDAPITPA